MFLSLKAIIASFVYISSAVIADFPTDNLKLIITVSLSTFFIPDSVTPKSEIVSFVSDINFPLLDKSAILTHLLLPCQYKELSRDGVLPICKSNNSPDFFHIATSPIQVVQQKFFLLLFSTPPKAH